MIQKFIRFAPHRGILGLLTFFLTSCITPGEIQPSLPPPIPDDPAPIATLTATPPPIPSDTALPTTTMVRTPPALPDIYISEYLNPGDTPHTYIEDTCEYLKNRWDPNNAAPGTVVMIVKLHGITRNEAKSSADVTVREFERMIENMREQGFEAINSKQLANFLENNAKIPPRSVVLLQDGRRTGENFNHRFRPYWEDLGWPVVNAWIVQTNSLDSLLQDNLALEQEGFVDHQLYSPLQRFSDNASEEYLSGELQKHIDIFEEDYGKAPIAIVWPDEPGLNFPKAARATGFRLGFTANARGPVMYNWIPQADRENPSRPAYYPEGPFDDPLMTLPRYWPLQVIKNLDRVRLTGKQAAAFAEQNKAIELEYYDIVCAPEYGTIPLIYK